MTSVTDGASVRAQLLTTVAEAVSRRSALGVLRVGIDGVDGAGKTHFADELAERLSASGRSTIRASVDGFHNPKAVRYRRGSGSPEGFFHDSYDYDQLKAALLDPLSPGGSGRYRPAVFDHRTDAPVQVPARQASPGEILVFDGIFLHRPELRGYWDYSIFLEVAFDISIPRGAQRGEGSPDPGAPQNRRYVEGQKIYLRTSQSVATVEALREVLLRADTLLFNTVVSGDQFAAVLERLGIAEAVKGKVVRLPPGPPIYQRVIQGKGNDIAAGVIPIIKETKGVRLIGPLPAELQTYQFYAAAPMTGAASPETAKGFIAFLASPAAKAAFAASGVE